MINYNSTVKLYVVQIFTCFDLYSFDFLSFCFCKILILAYRYSMINAHLLVIFRYSDNSQFRFHVCQTIRILKNYCWIYNDEPFYHINVNETSSWRHSRQVPCKEIHVYSVHIFNWYFCVFSDVCVQIIFRDVYRVGM